MTRCLSIASIRKVKKLSPCSHNHDTPIPIIAPRSHHSFGLAGIDCNLSGLNILRSESWQSSRTTSIATASPNQSVVFLLPVETPGSTRCKCLLLDSRRFGCQVRWDSRLTLDPRELSGVLLWATPCGCSTRKGRPCIGGGVLTTG